MNLNPVTRRILGLAVAVTAASSLTAHAADAGWQGRAAAPHYREEIFPPWQHGDNNPVTQRGLEFTVPEVDDLPDFHGDPFNAKLVIFLGGNYYFAMAPLMKAFEAQHPDLRGKLYYETIPPGLLIEQMKHGGTITVGNMTWTVKPDVYTAGKLKVTDLVKEGRLQAPVVNFATNDLAIMVPKGNPAGIRSLADLGKPDVRLVMPNPAWEGVARQIKLSLKKAGGEALERMVYETKVKDGRTLLTHIHHRQSPLFLMQGLADAGVTWRSEAIFMEQSGHPISYVAIPDALNTTAVYSAAVVKGAPHPAAARAWVNFLASPTALKILEHYGFRAAPK